MRLTRILLAALALLSAPGQGAYAQFAKVAPVRTVPAAPAAPLQLRLPLNSAPTGLAVPGLAAPSLTTPSLPTPSVSAKAVAVAAAAAPAQAAAFPLSRVRERDGVRASVGLPSPYPLPQGRERENGKEQATAKATLEKGAASLNVRGIVPAAALDAFFEGAKARAENSNAVAPEGQPSRTARPGLAPAAEPAPAPAPTVAAPQTAEDKPNVKALAGLFTSRTVSIASFILTSIAYPFLAVPVVGWAGFGALMAFGPLAAVATGPLNGLIAQRLSARKAMAINAGIRAALSLVLPVAAGFGFLNFGTLLVASVANGWIMSSVMTVEGAYLKKLAGEKALGTVNGLAWMNYLAIQVVLGLIVGVGSIVDKWDPSAAFYISAAVHALLVLPILWFTMPDLAPPGQRRIPSHVGLLAQAVAFFKSNALPLGAAALGVGAYLAFSTTLPLIAAILYWVTRSKSFKDVWSGAARADSPDEAVLREKVAAAADGPEKARYESELALRAKRLRTAMLYLSLAALFLFPLQYFVLPAAATALAGAAGAAGKGLILGRLLGALFLGNLVSVAARAKLPVLKLFGRSFKGERLVQGAVMALAAGWSLAALAPGSLVVAAAVAAAALGLMALAARLTDTGWVKLMGPGFAAVALPYLVWTAGLFPGFGPAAALTVSLLVAGMVYGPAFVALNTTFQRWVSPDKMGPSIGAQSSFFNGALSLGYGVISLAASFAPLPGLLGWMTLAYGVLGILFWLAPRFLPGLPATMFHKK
ncbi:MFS transporter [bacterium]|nr:MAG: MFS transporter [bacterium]